MFVDMLTETCGMVADSLHTASRTTLHFTTSFDLWELDAVG